MIKRLEFSAFFILLLVFTGKIYAQQEQSFAHFMFQPVVFNPAVVGNESNIQLNSLIRQQWVGLKGAPETYVFNIHAPISFLAGGVGATIIKDQIGPFNSTGLKIAYSYGIDFWQGNLKFGLSAGLINKSIDYGYFNVQDDPILAGSESESGMIFNLDAGIFYEVKDQYYFGISSTQLNQGKMILEAGSTSLKRNIYLHGGYYFELRQIPKILFHSSAMAVYTSASPLQINLGFVAEYNKKFWGGVTYKHQSAIGIMTGIFFKQFIASYAYEINLTPLKNGGSHELMLGYRFIIEIERGNKSYKNTRYL